MFDSSLSADILAGILALGGAALSPLDRWTYGIDTGATRRLLGYSATIFYLGALTSAAIGIEGWTRLLTVPAQAAAWLPAPAFAGPVLAVAVAAFFLFALLPLIQSLRGQRWRLAYAAAIRRAFASIPGWLPNDATERAAWIVLSLTAGICEEILFRGFLIRFLSEGGLAMPLVAALAISSLCFGLGHAYQGLKGVVNVTIAGIAFGLLFLLSGSLLACMVLHALMDLQGAYILHPVAGGVAQATSR